MCFVLFLFSLKQCLHQILFAVCVRVCVCGDTELDYESCSRWLAGVGGRLHAGALQRSCPGVVFCLMFPAAPPMIVRR